MKEIQKEKITRFINDSVMSEAVYRVLLEAFLMDRQGQGVQELAAARLAVSFLRAGFKELEYYKNIEEGKSTPSQNIGL